MEDINTGGPAFPCQHEGSTRSDAAGMNLRDYFAAKAMQGLVQNPNWRGFQLDSLVREAWGIADAMLSAREVK